MKRALILGALGLLNVGTVAACSDGGEDGTKKTNSTSSGGVTGVGGSGGSQLGVGGTVDATGGAPIGVGGANATSGGSATGGSATGGADATGGGSASGGATSSGSPGCGSTDLKSGRHTIQVNGQREYVLAVPASYDPNHPYPIVFGWHWRGGVANDVANGQGASFGPYYGLQQRAEGSMLFVAPEGLIDNGVTGWANPQGRDIQFAEALLDHLEQELCIDTERVFSTGFSYGGMFSYAIGCALADRFRAIAPMSGSLWSGCQAGNTSIAMWGFHGVTDDVVQIEPGRAARDEFLKRNGCSTSTTPVQPSGCLTYDCNAGTPLTWCEYDGGHFPPNNSSDAIWKFFSGF